MVRLSARVKYRRANRVRRWRIVIGAGAEKPTGRVNKGVTMAGAVERPKGSPAMNYDLVRLFEHPLKFRNCIPSAIVAFGGQSSGQYEVEVNWKRVAGEQLTSEKLILTWDTTILRPLFAEVDDEVAIL